MFLSKRLAKLEVVHAARLSRARGVKLLTVGGIAGPPIMRNNSEWRRLTAEGHTEVVGPLQANGAQRVTLAGRRVFVADGPLPA